MDSFTVALNILSLAVLMFMLYSATRALRAFRQSRQAVVESSSLINVIVEALTSRLEASEAVLAEVRRNVEGLRRQETAIEDEQQRLRSGYVQVLRHLQEALLNDKRLILELERIKSTLVPTRRSTLSSDLLPIRGNPAVTSSSQMLERLTPTERLVIELLHREGPKAAPELGKRMRKSREHMARLMKKLYLEGYVDRESNYAPFRYRLNEKVNSVLHHIGDGATTEASSATA